MSVDQLHVERIPKKQVKKRFETITDFKVLSKNKQLAYSVEQTCAQTNKDIKIQLEKTQQSVEGLAIINENFFYCQESLENLNTVDKQFLPQLYELKSMADLEAEHELRKNIRDYKKNYKLDAKKYRQFSKL